MKILLLGGRGRTGIEFRKYNSKHKILVFEGDITDANAVDAAMGTCDVVVSVIGHIKGSDADVQTRGMRNVIAAMNKRGVKRLVSLTGTGVRLPGDKITLIDKILNLSISVIDPMRVKDGIEHAKLIQGSDLDYTILRVLKLTAGASTSNWALSPHGPTKPFTSRADVAKAMLSVLEDATFIHSMPMITLK